MSSSGQTNTELELKADKPKKQTKTASKTNKRRAKSTIRRLRIDVTKARSSLELLRLAIKELNLEEVSIGRSDGRCDIFWYNGTFDLYNLPEKVCTINKFPGMTDILHKVELSKQLNRMKMLFPLEFDFYPKTWSMPDEYGQFAHHASQNKGTYIVKPTDGAQGDGIYLVTNPYSVQLGPMLIRTAVVQEYVPDPFIIDGFKFDLRLYVFLKRIAPLEFYLCDEGLARFCTEPYQKPNQRNLHKAFMHLTNYSLNKRSSSFVHSEENDGGSKRTLTSVLQQLENMGHDVNKLWSRIESLVCKTIVSIVPELRIEQDAAIAEAKKSFSCFQVLGFDILLDKNLKPLLLEVNGNPSMRIDSEHEVQPGRVEYITSQVDLAIKLPIVIDSLQMVVKMIRREENEDGPDLVVGCFTQLYPRLSHQHNHLMVFDKCADLFQNAVGVRMNNRMGPTAFRMLARRCKLYEFGISLAGIEILYIDVCRRYSLPGACRATMNFNAFCEALILLGEKKPGMEKKSAFEILQTILDHCRKYSIRTA